MAEGKTGTALGQFEIKIGGSAPQGLQDALAEVVVDTNLHMPAMFTIQLYDTAMKWTNDKGLLKVGQKVEITATGAEQGGRAQPGSGPKGKLISGEITALEPDFGEDGMVILTIRGYSKNHRLHRGKKTRSFLQVTDSDIVSKVAREAGLQVKSDATSVKYEYVLQNNQTDYEFLQARAQRIGFRCFVDEEDKLNFVKGDTSQSSGVTLKWGDTLRHFRPKLTTMQQDKEILVKGWDPKTKQAIVGRAQTGKIDPKVEDKGQGPSMAGVFGNAQAIMVNHPVGTQDEAQKIALALADEISGNFIRAEGQCAGNPKVTAGKTIQVQEVGTRFGGEYLVTAATHIFSHAEGYETYFTINGLKSDSLSYLMAPDMGDLGINDHQAKIYGVVVGLVTNNKDPEDRGRVKVKFPWLSDTDESNWARLVSPMAGPQRGIYYMPEVNDEVLVAFEHGDVNFPCVVGAVWNGKDKPPLAAGEAVTGSSTIRRIIKTRVGHIFLLVDKAGEESILIRDKTGNNEIFIDSVKNDISIKCDGNFSVEAKGKITMTSQMDFSFESKTGKVSGKGSTGMALETPATMSVKGNVAQIQSSGPMTVKGNPIALN